jgi:hypothetical protein
MPDRLAACCCRDSATFALSSQFAASRWFFVCLNSSGVRGAPTLEFCELIEYG